MSVYHFKVGCGVIGDPRHTQCTASSDSFGRAALQSPRVEKVNNFATKLAGLLGLLSFDELKIRMVLSISEIHNPVHPERSEACEQPWVTALEVAGERIVGTARKYLRTASCVFCKRHKDTGPKFPFDDPGKAVDRNARALWRIRTQQPGPGYPSLLVLHGESDKRWPVILDDGFYEGMLVGVGRSDVLEGLVQARDGDYPAKGENDTDVRIFPQTPCLLALHAYPLPFACTPLLRSGRGAFAEGVPSVRTCPSGQDKPQSTPWRH